MLRSELCLRRVAFSRESSAKSFKFWGIVCKETFVAIIDLLLLWGFMVVEIASLFRCNAAIRQAASQGEATVFVKALVNGNSRNR